MPRVQCAAIGGREGGSIRMGAGTGVGKTGNLGGLQTAAAARVPRINCRLVNFPATHEVGVGRFSLDTSVGPQPCQGCYDRALGGGNRVRGTVCNACRAQVLLDEAALFDEDGNYVRANRRTIAIAKAA
jgi:hypothetical protein